MQSETSVSGRPERLGRSRGRLATHWLAAGVGVGLVVAMVGTFLPWLQSGAVGRNSYAADGAIRRILQLDGVVGALLAAWPFLGVVCASAVALLVLGYVRTGATLAVLGALAAGTVSIAVLASSGSTLIHAATSGPVSTLTGSSVVLVSVLINFVAATIGASPLTSSARRLR